VTATLTCGIEILWCRCRSLLLESSIDLTDSSDSFCRVRVCFVLLISGINKRFVTIKDDDAHANGCQVV
jgi:hypothetical protein